MAEQPITFRELSAKTKAIDRRGLSHTYLVQMARGTAERVTPAAIEIVAEALGFEPATIAEYRLAEARRELDPREVGIDAALEALARFEASRPAGRGRTSQETRLPVPESLKRRAARGAATPEDPPADRETPGEGRARRRG